MKKLILAGAALAALVGAPVVMAQGADCQAGSAWGPTPGCDSASIPPSVYSNNSGSPVYPYSNRYVAPVEVPLAYAAPRITYPDGRQYMVDPRTGQVFLRGVPGDMDGDGYRDSRDNDRDGDGVKNYRDRYPDDPRFR